MKKLFSLLVILLLCVGCSNKSESAATKTNDDSSKEEVVETIDNNYYGEIAERASMEIKTSENKTGKCDVMISWSNSAFDHYEWTFTIDSLEGTVEFSDCTLTDIIFEESDSSEAVDGYLETDEILYNNGAGSLTFDNENNKVTWHSDVEDDSANVEDVVFVLSEY